MLLVSLSLSPRKSKKYRVLIKTSDGRVTKKVDFGARGYKDYTTTNDKERKKQYLARHDPLVTNEDWSIRGIDSAGFWSRWLLWNQPTVKQSIKDMNRRFYNELKVVF